MVWFITVLPLSESFCDACYKDTKLSESESIEVMGQTKSRDVDPVQS